MSRGTIPGQPATPAADSGEIDARTAMAVILEASAALCSHCQTPLLRPWRFCPNCGYELEWRAELEAAVDAPAAERASREVFSMPDCPFEYCADPGTCRPLSHCQFGSVSSASADQAPA